MRPGSQCKREGGPRAHAARGSVLPKRKRPPRPCSGGLSGPKVKEAPAPLNDPNAKDAPTPTRPMLLPRGHP